jgi:tetratricopeptide (TPR) repeat protein
MGSTGIAAASPPPAADWVRDARAWLLLAVLAAATTLAFWPSLHSTLIDEDFTFPAGEPADAWRPRQLWRLLADMRGSGFQPLTWATLCLDRVCWGLNPLGFHATNVTLHIGNCLLIYVLALRLFSFAGAAASCLRFSKLQHVGAFLAALLFALHPLRVEPVAWTAQRGVLLASLFVLLTVLFYCRAHSGGGRGWWAAALLCYAASLAAGPWGVTLPLVLLALDVYPLRRHARWRILAEKVPFVLLACVALVVATSVGSPGFLARLVLTAYGFFFYLWKTVWPDALLPIYESPQPLKLLTCPYLAAVGGIVVVGAVLAYVARRVPALVVAALCYVLLLLPPVMLLQTDLEQAGDRYSYLACVSCLLLLGAALARLLALSGREARAGTVVVVLLGLGVAGALGALSWRLGEVWRTPRTLWTYADRLAPRSALVAYQLGQQTERAGEYERAVQFYRAAAETRPNMIRAQLALGNALMQGLNYKDAATAYRRVLAAEPRNAEAHFLLGATLAAAGELSAAEQQLREAISLAPADVRPQRSLGHLLMMLKRWSEAVEAFRGALTIAPHDADLYYNLGRAYLQAGQTAEAMEAFQQTLRENPTNKLARRALDELAAPVATSRARE